MKWGDKRNELVDYTNYNRFILRCAVVVMFLFHHRKWQANRDTMRILQAFLED